ncbi:MAG: hypothetical protein FWC42_11130 [Proteobacteria bacterium]|nr:hypothetical protein [Pseudomonadota bacterium]
MKLFQNSILILGVELSILLVLFFFLGAVSPLAVNLYRPLLLAGGALFGVFGIWSQRSIVNSLNGRHVSIFRWPKPEKLPQPLNSNEKKRKMLASIFLGSGGFIGLYSIHEHLTNAFTNAGMSMGIFSALKIDTSLPQTLYVALGLLLNLILSNYGLWLIKPLFLRQQQARMSEASSESQPSDAKRH